MSRKRHSDYVDQIEQIVREAGRPYVAVDDARKAIFSGAQIDSFDLLIYMPDGPHVLATVLPPSRPKPTVAQITALVQWERVFGSGFTGAFIHASDQPAAWWLPSASEGQPPQPIPLRKFLGVKAKPECPAPAPTPPPAEPPADPPPVPVCVDGQQVFDAGCIQAHTQLSLF